MGYPARMQVLQYIDNLSNVELSHFLCKTVNMFFHESNELPQLAVLHYEVQLVLVLKSVLKFYDTWVAHAS